MRIATSKVGLLAQEFVLGLSDSNMLVEQVELPPIARDRVNVLVLPGTVAVIGGVKYKGQELPYKLNRAVVGSKHAATAIYLLPDKRMDTINVSFFGGQHMVSNSALPSVKAKFSIVGTATVEIADFKALANYVKRTITKEQLVEEINATLRAHLSNEVSVAASRYITAETTEVTLRSALNDVAKDVISSKKTISALMNMGLALSARGISMHINALDDAEDKIKLINDVLADKEAAPLHHDLPAQDASAENSDDTVTTDPTTNSSEPVEIDDMPDDTCGDDHYCRVCGAEIPAEAAFCPLCGRER